MIKCVMCKETAKYKDNLPIIRGESKIYLYYCTFHKNAGIIFGWLEKNEMEKI